MHHQKNDDPKRKHEGNGEAALGPKGTADDKGGGALRLEGENGAWHCKATDGKVGQNALSEVPKRRGILDGVCITGGEPLLNRDIAPFISRIKEMGFLVKLDTNGSFPERLASLIDGGLLDYVAMDIKNSPEKYPLTTGTEDGALSKVKESVSILLKGSLPFEFRTTLVKGMHTEADMEKIGAWIKGAERYFLQQFTDSGDVLCEGLSAFNKEESEALLASVLPFVPKAALRGI